MNLSPTSAICRCCIAGLLTGSRQWIACLALFPVLFCLDGTVAAAQPRDGPPAAVPMISLEPAPDAAIARRIHDVFENFEALREIEVSVQGGVVSLAGEVPSPADRERAATVARRIEGVVDVRNELRVGDDIATQAARTYQRLMARVADYLLYLPVVALSLIVFMLFWLAGRWVARDRLYRRLTTHRFVRQLAAQTARTIVVVVGLVVALEIVEATFLIGAVLGAAGLTGLVIGFALRETVENYVAGVLLSLRQPFSPHDHVLVQGYEGQVVRLTSRATVLLTHDGNHVRIPNALVFKGVIVNYTRNPERRFGFTVGVAVDTDMIEAQCLAIETLRSIEGVLHAPPPDAWIAGPGDSSVSLYILGWLDQRRHSFPKVRGEAIRLVLERFAQAGIEMPEPIHRVNLSSLTPEIVDGTPAPGAPRRAAAAPQDLSRDSHLDREIADERAQMAEEDLLDPTAAKE